MYWICVRYAGVDERLCPGSVCEEVATVNLNQREDSELKTGHEAKISRAPFQRPEEIRVRILVDLQDFASSCHEFIVHDMVRSPARYRAIIAHTTTKREAANADSPKENNSED